jgi:bifunctional non-homologous end joining protein LigD
MGGVLKSWAVPKGPSLDPSVKRLAIMVEDHPFDYRDFEGVIPEGNYGAGSVMIWDRGIYGSPFAEDKKESEKYLLEGLKKGDLKFALAGTKLKGGFALVKTKWEKNSWLLIKEKDKYASTNDVLSQDRSSASGKTMEDIAGHVPYVAPQAAVKQTPVKKAPVNSMHPAKVRRSEPALPGLRSRMPHNVRPMLAYTAKKPFDGSDWIFEIKWDGYRAVAEMNKKNVLLYSRNGLPLMNKFSPIAASLQKLGLEAVLDGEVIAVDKNGLPDFQLLQDGKRSGAGLIYYVFDVLFYNGHDLTGMPLIKRKELLKSILPSTGNIRFSGHVAGDGISFFNAAKKKGLEGVVAKYSKSLYRQGVRSRFWLKIKNRVTQDCVIAGFTRPRGARKYFGSLVLGVAGKGGLIYAGHSGGGFGAKNLRAIYGKLLPLTQKKCPFKTRPPEDTEVTWVKPLLVCEVEFTEWTKEGIMRHPVFLRMRQDKQAKEAVREM